MCVCVCVCVHVCACVESLAVSGLHSGQTTCCKYPPNIMPPVHPAENGYFQGANQTGYLSNIGGPGGTSGAHTTCREEVVSPPASS